MVGETWSTMTTGGDTYTPMTTNSRGRTSPTTRTGAEAPGETSTGGGIERLENSMTRSTLPQKVTSAGGMGCLTTRTCLPTTWTCPHPGYDITRISLDFGGEIALLLIG